MLTTVGRSFFWANGIRKYATNVEKTTTKAISSPTWLETLPRLACERLVSENGRQRTRVKRKDHFMNVVTLYLLMRGRNIPRYRPKLMPLTSISTMPAMLECSTPFPLCTELNIRKRIPTKLIITPPVFLKVIGSFRKMAANIMVNIGLSVPRTAVSMEVVVVMASRNEA